MAYTSDFLTIIEQARKHKGLSVKNLCEQIISERTYYRFLKEDNEVPFDILVQLAERLELNLNQIMIYSMFFSKNYSFLYTFLYRVQIALYDDIKEHYEGIKKQYFDNEAERLLAQAYIKKYECESGQITKANYQISLEQIIDAFGHQHNILKDLVIVFYYGIKKHSQQAFVDLAKHVDLHEKNLSLHFQIMLIDELLYLFTDIYDMDIDIFQSLLEKYKLYASKFTINHYVMRIHLYEAYLAKINHHQTKMYDELYVAILMLNNMYGGEQLKRYIKMIENVSGINIRSFMVSYSKNSLVNRLEIERL